MRMLLPELKHQVNKQIWIIVHSHQISAAWTNACLEIQVKHMIRYLGDKCSEGLS